VLPTHDAGVCRKAIAIMLTSLSYVIASPVGVSGDFIGDHMHMPFQTMPPGEYAPSQAMVAFCMVDGREFGS